MKKSYNVSFLLMLLPCFIFLSCSEDGSFTETEFSISSSELTLEVGVQETVYIKGDGVYAATSELENVVSVTIENDKILITPIQIGVTVITIDDTRKNAIYTPQRLTVEVKEHIAKFYVAYISPYSSMDDESYSEEIKQDMESNSLFALKDTLEFIFYSTNNGQFYLYSEKAETYSFDGVFSWMETPGYVDYTPTSERVEKITIKSKEKEYNFSSAPLAYISAGGKSIPTQGHYSFNEDLTDMYKEKYPQAGINYIGCRYSINNVNGWY